MTQFKPYPIHIVYSKHNQDDARGMVSRLNREKDYEWEKFANNAAITTEDSDPAYQKEVEDYHRDIHDRLKAIEKVPFGKMLLGLLKSDVYIVPWMPGKHCYCAQTRPLDYEIAPFDYSEGKGDTYIWLDPNDDFKDDTLFHELVHAYRYSAGKFSRRAMANNEYNTEEFLAHQMQNIYRSFKRLWLEFTYNDGTVARHPGKWGTKEEIYSHYTSDPDFVMVLKHFLDFDDFARMIGKLPYPDFNPFRDYKTLERRYLRALGDPKIKSLPAF
jgi:hypothetical protein